MDNKKELPSVTTVEHLQRVLQYFRPNKEDPTFLIIKAHLLSEEVLFDFVAQQVTTPNCLREARLSYSQLIELARSMHVYAESDSWVWDVSKKLNALRNIIAHRLEADEAEKRISDFVLSIKNGFSNSKNPEVVRETKGMLSSGMSELEVAVLTYHVGLISILRFDPLKLHEPPVLRKKIIA